LIFETASASVAAATRRAKHFGLSEVAQNVHPHFAKIFRFPENQKQAY
jgi:hypothetical protein